MARSSNPNRDRRAAEIVGRDLARLRRARPRAPRSPGLWLIAALIAGLGLAALRIDNLRLRYALAEAVATEQSLLEEQSVWTARKASLADPTRLAELAKERGFVRPTEVIELHPVQMTVSVRP